MNYINLDAKPLFMNIYICEDGDKISYVYSGVLPPDCQCFYLVFQQMDEERLPFATEFKISDDLFDSFQYQLLSKTNLPVTEIPNLFLQFEKETTTLYFVSISPGFPFPVDICGQIILSE